MKTGGFMVRDTKFPARLLAAGIGVGAGLVP